MTQPPKVTLRRPDQAVVPKAPEPAGPTPAGATRHGAHGSEEGRIKRQHDILLIHPDDPAWHTSICRLTIVGHTDLKIRYITWHVDWSGYGVKSKPRVISDGSPNAKWLGALPADGVYGADVYSKKFESSGAAVWVLDLGEPLRPNESREITIVQTFRDTRGTFIPVHSVRTGDVPPGELVLEVQFPPSMLPRRVRASLSGTHPDQNHLLRDNYDRREARAVLNAGVPVRNRVYALRWWPAVGRGGTRARPRGAAADRRDYLAFTARKHLHASPVR